MKPYAIDLYCGLGGWADGLLAEGYDVIGYDIEAHDYGTGGYPGTLVLRDVRSIHGSEFKHASLIVGSSPCQEFSYRAMPWSRAKALPPPYLGMELFNAQFRIQREASEAAGRNIPMVVENVRGAQKWVGRAAWHYGSFYLWGDVPALMPMTLGPTKSKVNSCKRLPGANGGRISGWPHIEENGVKVGGTNLSKVGFNVAAVRKMLHGDPNMNNSDGRKRGITIGGTYAERKARGDTLITTGSKSKQRKMASAMIAKIPFPLAQHIARAYYPLEFA